MKQSTTEKNRRAQDEIRRVLNDGGMTVQQLATLLNVKWSYLNSILNQGRVPSDEFLNTCDSITWPKSVKPALPWLKRIVNTHYIRTGYLASETEIFLYKENQELTELADLQRKKINILEMQLRKAQAGSSEKNSGLRLAANH